jgi:hypothetical protein
MIMETTTMMERRKVKAEDPTSLFGQFSVLKI